MTEKAIALHAQQEKSGLSAQEKFQLLFCSLDQDLYASVEATSASYLCSFP